MFDISRAISSPIEFKYPILFGFYGHAITGKVQKSGRDFDDFESH